MGEECKGRLSPPAWEGGGGWNAGVECDAGLGKF